MKRLILITILMIIVTHLKANTTLTNEDIKRYFLFHVVDKSFNNHSNMKVEMDYDINCLQGNQTSCTIKDFQVVNINFSKLFYVFKAKQLYATIPKMIIDEEKIDNDVNNKWIIYEKEIINSDKEEKKKLLRQKNMKKMEFKNRFVYKKIISKTNTLTFKYPTIKYEPNNRFHPISKVAVLNWDNQTIQLSEINENFFLNYHVNRIKKLKIIFENTTNLKGMPKILERKKYEDAEKDIFNLVSEIKDKNTNMDFTFNFKDDSFVFTTSKLKLEGKINSKNNLIEITNVDTTDYIKMLFSKYKNSIKLLEESVLKYKIMLEKDAKRMKERK